MTLVLHRAQIQVFLTRIRTAHPRCAAPERGHSDRGRTLAARRHLVHLRVLAPMLLRHRRDGHHVHHDRHLLSHEALLAAELLPVVDCSELVRLVRRGERIALDELAGRVHHPVHVRVRRHARRRVRRRLKHTALRRAGAGARFLVALRRVRRRRRRGRRRSGRRGVRAFSRIAGAADRYRCSHHVV